MPEPALEALGISKRYPESDALSGVSLIANPGELHGLLGPNGAGKTTLLRVVLGLVRRDAGTVRMFGRLMDAPFGPMPDGVAGFVETPAFYPYLSGRRNLELLARLDDRRAASGAGVADVLERLALADAANVDVAAYSAGMRQRLGIAACLLRSPRLLLLDEPTSSLDPASAHALRQLVRRLAADGVAVVLSSHDMSEVEALCAAVTIIDHGRVLYSGTIDGLRNVAPGAAHALHTSDDRMALTLAAARPGLRVTAAVDRDGLDVVADTASLDAYVLALAQIGVAVRTLEQRERSLESLFLQLTSGPTKDAAVPLPPRNPLHAAEVSS
jgi:ABC-2 type transport system ATP-binding protein